MYTLSILEEGLKNKQKIEELYEQTRTEMLDIWEIIDYPKRNEFVRPKIQAAIADMKKFTVEDKLVMIPFFDPLINALYESRNRGAGAAAVFQDGQKLCG